MSTLYAWTDNDSMHTDGRSSSVFTAGVIMRDYFDLTGAGVTQAARFCYDAAVCSSSRARIQGLLTDSLKKKRMMFTLFFSPLPLRSSFPPPTSPMMLSLAELPFILPTWS